MKYPILLSEDSPNRYTATALALSDCSAEGTTEAEAVAKVKEEIAKRTQDAKVLLVEVPSTSPNGENPWMEFAGHAADDPDWEEYLTAIAEYRKSVDEEP